MYSRWSSRPRSLFVQPARGHQKSRNMGVLKPESGSGGQNQLGCYPSGLADAAIAFNRGHPKVINRLPAINAELMQRKCAGEGRCSSMVPGTRRHKDQATGGRRKKNTMPIVHEPQLLPTPQPKRLALYLCPGIVQHRATPFEPPHRHRTVQSSPDKPRPLHGSPDPEGQLLPRLHQSLPRAALSTAPTLLPSLAKPVSCCAVCPPSAATGLCCSCCCCLCWACMPHSPPGTQLSETLPLPTNPRFRLLAPPPTAAGAQPTSEPHCPDPVAPPSLQPSSLPRSPCAPALPCICCRSAPSPGTCPPAPAVGRSLSVALMRAGHVDIVVSGVRYLRLAAIHSTT